jgi:integration host factor subunit alpha
MSDTLTKAHIVEAVAEANGYTHKKSVETVETLLELIKSELESSDDVMISGFGKFCIKKKKRKGRNPATGKDMILTPRKVVTFKWSGKLNEKMNTKSKKRRAKSNKNFKLNLPSYNPKGPRWIEI